MKDSSPRPSACGHGHIPHSAVPSLPSLQDKVQAADSLPCPCHVTAVSLGLQEAPLIINDDNEGWGPDAWVYPKVQQEPLPCLQVTPPLGLTMGWRLAPRTTCSVDLMEVLLGATISRHQGHLFPPGPEVTRTWRACLAAPCGHQGHE